MVHSIREWTRWSVNVDDDSIKDDWYEVWADDMLDRPYLLMVRRRPGEPEIAVIDPAERYRTVFSSPDYETVRNWLLEDEYTRVTGRMMPESDDQ
ncbi:MAG TPA: hypothetical protein VMP01_26355 [Pirellulaceae bacterium]|nr:hypothetical protein [Pirellulaceae bacterium]